MGLQNHNFDIASNDQSHCAAIDLAVGADIDKRFCYWKGASGAGYIHTVYSLVDAPELPTVNYVLVYRDKAGRRHPLRIGRTHETSGSLNLADIRYRAARLGANEVHVHLISETSRDRALVECDLRAGLFHSLSSERVGCGMAVGLN